MSSMDFGGTMQSRKNSSSNNFFAVYLMLMLAVFGPLSWHALIAQGTYAAVHGTVTDKSGAIVPNAQITVLNGSTGITITGKTDSKGYFILPQLQAGGPYSVTVTAPGFNSFSANGITLVVNDNRDVDAKLEVGTSSTTVQVSATALQVETSDTQLKQVDTAETIEETPLLGRDVSGLEKLQPGAVESSDRFGTYSTNGSQSTQNSFLLNGTDINDGPLQNEGISVNPDALQEQDIVTSTLNPEFSRNSGAIVNQIVKPGTNHFHGSGFEFYRDTFLNNGNYFSLSSADRPVFHQNVYGGTIGGPVFKDKLFFFLAYQGTRNRTGSTTVQQTLSSAQRAGQFSNDINLLTNTSNALGGLSSNPLPFNVAGCTKGETWSQCFPSGTVNISTSQFNSIASNLTNTYVPAANETLGGVPYYNFNANDTSAADQGVIRVDYTPTSHDTIWASSIFQSSPSTSTLTFGGGSFPGFGSVEAEHFKIFSASYTHSFNSSTLNELKLGYYRFDFAAVEPASLNPPSSLGFSINPQLANGAGVPYMSIGPYFSLGFSYEGPQPRLDTNLTYADNFTKIVGNHSLKFGASYEQFRVDNPFALYNNGYYGYNGAGIYSSGDPLIDFELGIPDQFLQTNDGHINALSGEIYAYAQDNWKVTPDFTFNYGIAWDVEQPTKNAQDGGLGIVCWSNSNFASSVFPGAPPGLSFPGDPGCNRAGGPTSHYNRFAPRIGFAWSPSAGPEKIIGNNGSHDFSIRGGFGIYYNRDQEEQSLQNLEDPPAFYVSHGAADLAGLSPAFANPYTDVAGNGSKANPFPFASPTKGQAVDWQGLYDLNELSTFDPTYSVPYTYNYNLNMQRSLPANSILQIAYVGSLGRRLASWYEGDNITQAGHDACVSGAAASPIVPGVTCQEVSSSIPTYFPQLTAQPAIDSGTGLPWYTTVARQTTEGASNYNSFQASLIKGRTHGLSATFAYTYSHGLDNSSGYESSTGSKGRSLNFTPGYQYLNYGDSDYDARHRFVTSYTYEVPIASFMADKPFLRAGLAGWELSGVTALQTGFPVQVYEGTQNSYYCSGSYFGCADSPNTTDFHPKSLNPRAKVDGASDWFSTTPFTPEAYGTFGNTKRNYFHGPGFNYTNLQVSKNIHLTADGVRYVQLRLEAYNAFNHANFDGPSGDFSSPDFGQITSVIQSAETNGDPQPARAIQLSGKFFF